MGDIPHGDYSPHTAPSAISTWGDIPHGDYSPHTTPTAISTWEIYHMATIALTPHPQLYQHGRYTAWRL